MARLRVIALGAVWACAATARADDANQAWRELFAQEVPAEANAQLQAVLDAVGHDLGRLKALIASDAAYEVFRPGWTERRTQVADGNTTHAVEFLVRVPGQYTPTKSWPLLLACHGQGGTGAAIGEIMEKLLGPAVEQFILLAPMMPGPAIYNGRPYQEQAFLKPLDWARLRLNVDDERICVSGYSQGGHHTWHLATMYPRLFAAAVPMAGAPVFEGAPYTCHFYHENLAHLPLWSIWGEKDVAEAPAQGIVDVNRQARDRLAQLGITTYRGTEMPGVGHDRAVPDPAEFRKFLTDARRARVPGKFSHAFHLWHHRQGYYLTATALSRMPLELSQDIQVEMPFRPGRPPTSQEVLDAGRALLERSLFRFAAELDPARNTLTVQGRNVRAVRLAVMEGMFDLSKPVVLRYFGRLWTGSVAPSARAMLLHYAAARDAAALVVNEIDLETSGLRRTRYSD